MPYRQQLIDPAEEISAERPRDRPTPLLPTGSTSMFEVMKPGSGKSTPGDFENTRDGVLMTVHARKASYRDRLPVETDVLEAIGRLDRRHGLLTPTQR